MQNKIPVRFFVVTFLWSWIFWGLAILIGQGGAENLVEMAAGIEFPLMIIGAFGPMMGAFYSLRTIDGKGAIKNHLKQYLSLKFGWKVWIAMFAVLGISAVVAWILPELWGMNRLPMLLPNIWIFPIYFVIMIFFGGGQEEVGWRGYISPYLEKKFGLFYAPIILGIVWAAWHLPLWFMPGSSQTYMNFFGFTVGCIGYSYFFSWVIKESGNRLFSGLVVHGLANAFAPLFPWIIMEPDANQIRFWIYCILIFIIGIIIVTLRIVKSRKNGI